MSKDGRFLSLILRHKPEEIGLKLDKHGWAYVAELLGAMKKHGRPLLFVDLEKIVAEDNKQRFSFNPDRSKIRANQGHSIDIDLALTPAEPPTTLYHGTARAFLDKIKVEGLQKMSRKFVHLSSDFNTALKVGSRHGKPVVLEIAAKQMYNDGWHFYLSENKVWLVYDIPFKYVSAMRYE